MDLQQILQRLEAQGSPADAEGQRRFGITPRGRLLGMRIPDIRAMAKEIGKNHELAAQLWETDVHEARLLATMIANPKQMTEAEMDAWAADFDTWDVCDQCCSNLFQKTPFAYQKALEWSSSSQEFVKRAGFVMMARVAVADKKAPQDKLAAFLPIIEREAADERNMVKKAVNWALRQIGKHSRTLNKLAIESATRIEKIDSKAARWNARDALRELTSEAVQKRLKK